MKKATQTPAKRPVTITAVIKLFSILVGLGVKDWNKSEASITFDATDLTSGRVMDANYDDYYFYSLEEAKQLLEKFINNSKEAARLAALRALTHTDISGVAGYTAQVSPDGIVLGCQTVSFEKFDEVAAAVAKARANAPKPTAKKTRKR